MVGPHLVIMHCPSISNNPEWSFCLNKLWKLVLPTGASSSHKWISSSLRSGHTRQPELQNMASLSPFVIMLYQNRTYYVTVLCKIKTFEKPYHFWDTLTTFMQNFSLISLVVFAYLWYRHIHKLTDRYHLNFFW